MISRRSENTFRLLQWVFRRNRYLQAWGRFEDICLQNDTVYVGRIYPLWNIVLQYYFVEKWSQFLSHAWKYLFLIDTHCKSLNIFSDLEITHIFWSLFRVYMQDMTVHKYITVYQVVSTYTKYNNSKVGESYT